MEQDKVFPDGMNWFKPREGAPDFVKGAVSIEPNRFYAWMKANKHHMNAKGYFILDLKKGRDGKLYFQLNTYKPPVVGLGTNEPISDPEAIPF